MSQKFEKTKRYLIKKLIERAEFEYHKLSFWQKLKWHFNTKSFVDWYVKNNKDWYFGYLS